MEARACGLARSQQIRPWQDLTTHHARAHRSWYMDGKTDVGQRGRFIWPSCASHQRVVRLRFEDLQELARMVQFAHAAEAFAVDMELSDGRRGIQEVL